MRPLSCGWFKLLTLIMLSFSLLGCEVLGFNEYDKRNQESDKIADKIDRHQQGLVQNKVETVNFPPVDIRPIQPSRYAWLDKPVQISAYQQPLEAVLIKLSRQAGVSLQIQSDVKRTLPVSLSINGTFSEALNQLQALTDIALVPSALTLSAQPMLSETFELSLTPGSISDQIGESSSGESGDSEEGSSQLDGQFVTLSSEDINPFEQVELGVRALLADTSSDGNGLVGSVKAMSSLSRLVVRTTPSRMRAVRAFIEQSDADLNAQVLLKVEVLEFRSNLGHERGIDWNLVKDIGGGNSLKFFVPGTSLETSGGSGMAFTGGGKWSGSKALIQALNQQGQTATQSPISLYVQNYQTNHITTGNTVDYISRLSSESDEGVVSSNIEVDTRRSGMDFIVVPNIQDEKVHLRISGLMSQILEFESQDINGQVVKFPKMKESKLNMATNLRYGQTIVLSSISQEESSTEDNTFLGIPFLGGWIAHTQRVETLVLLTPIRADG
ncbi:MULTISPECIES: type II secretion system protein GspD [Vibrio]|uniref:Type II/III secretion system secretin-like domain-containing protein n=1 Tax=Vibrio splendidus TaxID=29497 RepID=A0A2N7JJB7_VIBSP|nr:hypothetical protein [Vibrio splendidus]PMM40554.1 hypothetical protein BCT54_12165 [Vibrio splendidus]